MILVVFCMILWNCPFPSVQQTSRGLWRACGAYVWQMAACWCCLLLCRGGAWQRAVCFGVRQCPVRGFHSTCTHGLPGSGLINGFGQKTAGSSQFGNGTAVCVLGASAPCKLPRRERRQSWEVWRGRCTDSRCTCKWAKPPPPLGYVLGPLWKKVQTVSRKGSFQN